MELFIVRHGSTEWNKLNKIQGCLDIPLDDEGIKQGYLLANKLKNYNIEHIYSSDLSRAKNSAEIISESLNLKFTIDSRLREMNFGEWQGLSFDQISILDRIKLNEWRNQPSKVKFENGECIDDVKKRSLDFFEEIYKKNEHSNVLVVTHGTFIKILILSLLNINLDLYKNLKQDNTALNIIKIIDSKPTLQLYNDTCHLRCI